MPDVTYHDSLGGHGTNTLPACAISVGDQLVVKIFNLSNTAAPSCAGWTMRATTTDGGNASWSFTKDALAVSGDIGTAVTFTFAGTLSSFVFSSYGNVGSVGAADANQVYGGSTWTARSISAVAAGAAYVIGIMGLDPVTAGGSGTTKRANGDSGITYEINLFDKLGLASGATGALTGSMGSGSLEYQFVGVILEPSAGGGTDTPMTISATQAQTATRQRALNIPRAATQAQTPSRVRALARALSATIAQTPVATKVRNLLSVLSVVIALTVSRLRNVGFTRGATVTQTTGSAPTIAGDFAFTATQTQTPTRTRAVAPVAKSATVTATPSRLRDLARAISATVSQTASMIKGQGFFRTLSATQTQTASRVRELGIVRAATQTQTQTVARAVGRAFTYVATQTLTRVRAVARVLSGVNTETPSADVAQGSGSMTVSVVVTQTVTTVRALGRAVLTGQVQTPTRLRAVSKVAIAATQTQTPSVIKGQGYFRNFSATVTQVPARVLSAGVARLAAIAQSLATRRDIGRSAATTQTQTPSRQRDLARAASADATQTPTMVKGQGFFMTVAATVVQTPARAISLGLARLATAVQSFVVTRLLGRRLTATQHQTPSVTKEVESDGPPFVLVGPRDTVNFHVGDDTIRFR